MMYYGVCMLLLGVWSNVWGAEKRLPFAAQQHWASMQQPTSPDFNVFVILKMQKRETIAYFQKQKQRNILEKTRKVGDLTLAKKLSDLLITDDVKPDITPPAPKNGDSKKEKETL